MTQFPPPHRPKCLGGVGVKDCTWAPPMVLGLDNFISFILGAFGGPMAWATWA